MDEISLTDWLNAMRVQWGDKKVVIGDNEMCIATIGKMAQFYIKTLEKKAFPPIDVKTTLKPHASIEG